MTTQPQNARSAPASSSPDLPEVRKLLAWPVMAFLIIACTGSIAQLPAASEFGLGAIPIYLIPALLFMIPSALISAELATGWEGGVFAWVREAFGDRFGFQAIWLQWIQSVALYPSLLAFAAASLAYAFGKPNLAQNGLYTGAVILVIFWAATLVAFRGLNASARLSSVGLVLGTLIPSAALIILMFVWLYNGNPSAAPLKLSDVMPPFTGMSSLVLIIGTFIAFAGTEVNAVHIREMRNPGRNYPRGVVLAVVVIFTIYVLGTISIAAVIPKSQLNLDAGAAQTFVTYMQGLGLWPGGQRACFPVGIWCARRGFHLGDRPQSGAAPSRVKRLSTASAADSEQARRSGAHSFGPGCDRIHPCDCVRPHAECLESVLGPPDGHSRAVYADVHYHVRVGVAAAPHPPRCAA
jgi:glutamate:GABA antiporter